MHESDAVSAVFEFLETSVVFAETIALDAVSMSVCGFGITVVLGPSGSGKSTLLRLCNRLEIPTSGQVLYHGRPVEGHDPQTLRREVGMVFQQPTLFPGTVRDNLLLAAPDSGDDELRAGLERAGLERVALDMGLLDRDAASLSGGEAQRLCLARTLLADPRVLLLDEPTSALDATPRLGFERTIRQLADAGMPVLWVTHDLEQVLRIADQLIVLDAGRVALVLDDVTGASRHPIVARLFDPEGADGNR